MGNTLLIVTLPRFEFSAARAHILLACSGSFFCFIPFLTTFKLISTTVSHHWISRFCSVLFSRRALTPMIKMRKSLAPKGI